MPGTNFFCLDMPDELRAALSEVAQAAATSPQAVFGLADENVSFEPMAYDDLHITTLFMGPTLQRLKPEQLALIKAGICSRQSQSPCHLVFAGLSLFPPGKLNLLVAHFKPSPALTKRWLELREDTTSALSDAASPDMASTVSLANDPLWIVHSTLGKIRATTSQVGRIKESQLVTGLAGANGQMALFENMPPLQVTSLSLCGQPPGCTLWTPSLSFNNLPL
jgi:2'-5' RNA ligase